MRELIDAFFRERSIVNHHIASFNDFLPTIDNPNSRMQRIVDNLRSSPEDERRGIIKLDEDRTEGDVIETRIGRQRADRGRIDREGSLPPARNSGNPSGRGGIRSVRAGTSTTAGRGGPRSRSKTSLRTASWSNSTSATGARSRSRRSSPRKKGTAPSP